MWGSSMCMREPVVPTLKHNWQHTKKPKFLQHVGIQHVRERTSGTNLEAQLAAEKKGNAELCEIVNTLTKKVEES